MPLIDLLLRSTLGANRAPDLLSVALFNGSRESRNPGYRRAEVRKGGWSFQNRGGKYSAETTVRFGPFLDVPAEFDRAVLMRGDEIIDISPFPDGHVQNAAPGTVWEHTYVSEFWKA